MSKSKLKNTSAAIFALTGLFSIGEQAFAQSPCPSGMSVSFDLSKTQNASIKNENTYIVILGSNPTSKKFAYVKFDKGNKQSSLADINDASVNGKDYGIPLSQLSQDSQGFANACIPKLISGRIYISFGNALDMPTDPYKLTPIHPDINNAQTTTNGTLFDKVEFNYSRLIFK